MKKQNPWSAAAARRRRVPAFMCLWRLERALEEHDWKRARKSIGALRERGFEVKVIGGASADLEKGAGI
jgi:hypothetical protein